jgi:hypothetical protein
MSTSRQIARDALVDLLTTALVGAGLPAKTVVGSKPNDLKGRTPLVAVLSGGTNRETGPINRPTFLYEVQVWVLQKGAGWTTEQAEDAVDTIEQLISETYDANRGTVNWEIVQYATASRIDEVAVANIAYYRERIPTIVRLAKS